MENLPQKFDTGEIFYITDANIIGVGDINGDPQLLVSVKEYIDKKRFPKKPQNSVLYQSINEEQLYYYDTFQKKYLPMRLKDSMMISASKSKGDTMVSKLIKRMKSIFIQLFKRRIKIQ